MRNRTVTLMAVLTMFFLAAAVFAPHSHSASDRGDRGERSEDEAMRYDDREYKFVLGSITDDQGWRLLVNESERVLVTSETKIYNAREREIRRGSLKSGVWVYLEGPINTDGAIEAERVYLLPGRVKPGDYGKYPFINIAPVPWRP